MRFLAVVAGFVVIEVSHATESLDTVLLISRIAFTVLFMTFFSSTRSMAMDLCVGRVHVE